MANYSVQRFRDISNDRFHCISYVINSVYVKYVHLSITKLFERERLVCLIKL